MRSCRGSGDAPPAAPRVHNLFFSSGAYTLGAANECDPQQKAGWD